ncbi:zinc-dependent alcohol dehydrogenase family protein [Pistricoccus aurantiacus]|uniref:alcohol dehydrogenase n=2 Tax=Pistricoccus aurantiacus TaxID=1883414 RepID=A0A5B8T1S4_9GAMM|nr:zinc-dependent alcohol dehydrogenase family protein [Pistricoccus aurantiacus]
MRAMVLPVPGAPLEMRELPRPIPGPGQVRLKVQACGVCRTDLHVVDGELPEPRLPLVPGHEIVGRIDALGEGVDGFEPDDRVGVPWLGWTCGTCRYCRHGQENLCVQARFTGYTLDGGYAEYSLADARFCFPVDESFEDVAAAPLLCAGLIGHRAWSMIGEGVEHLGIYGFGAAAHILAQVAIHEEQSVYAFTRPGDEQAKEFAYKLGAVWAGDSDQLPPQRLDAAIIFAPVGELVPAALKAVRPGGTVVCGGIHMSDIPAFPYRLLWEERVLRSVANLTRADGHDFMALAPRAGVRTHTRRYPLADANQALADLREGRLSGAAVLVP